MLLDDMKRAQKGPTPDISTMGGRIRAERQKKELSLQDLADVIERITGESITKGAVALWERNETDNIKNANMLALCEALEVDEPYLVYGPQWRRRLPRLASIVDARFSQPPDASTGRPDKRR